MVGCNDGRNSTRASWSLTIYRSIFVVASISVQQKDLVKDVMVCRDVLMSAYKIRHPNDTDDPQDFGLEWYGRADRYSLADYGFSS